MEYVYVLIKERFDPDEPEKYYADRQVEGVFHSPVDAKGWAEVLNREAKEESSGWFYYVEEWVTE